jgi:hypothetical protein
MVPPELGIGCGSQTLPAPAIDVPESIDDPPKTEGASGTGAMDPGEVVAATPARGLAFLRELAPFGAVDLEAGGSVADKVPSPATDPYVDLSEEGRVTVASKRLPAKVMTELTASSMAGAVSNAAYAFVR